MASYLRPRRGKEATAKSQNIVLKRGEIFFETPAGGVGTGIGRLKMGDGSTSYASLPYFLKQLDLNDNNTKCAFTNVTAATNKSNNSTYLNNIAPGNSLKTLFQNIKQLLLNYNSQLTSLNNDLATSGPTTDNYVTGIRFGKICVISYNHASGGVVKNHEYQLTTVSKLRLLAPTDTIYTPLIVVDANWNNPAGAVGSLKLNINGNISFISTYGSNNAYSYIGFLVYIGK